MSKPLDNTDAALAAVEVAKNIAEGSIKTADLEGFVTEKCRELVGRVVGPDDPLWSLQVYICKRVLEVGGGVSLDELREWVSVYEHSETLNDTKQ